MVDKTRPGNFDPSPEPDASRSAGPGDAPGDAPADRRDTAGRATNANDPLMASPRASERRYRATRSYAAINGHPIHPMLVPLPIGAFVFLFFTDLLYLATAGRFWADASYVLLIAGVVTGAIAGLVGAMDYLSIDRAQNRHGHIHAIGNSVVLVLGILNWAIRLGDTQDGVWPWGLLVTLVMIGLLAVTGWEGGELAYRHRIGMIPDPDEEAEAGRQAHTYDARSGRYAGDGHDEASGGKATRASHRPSDRGSFGGQPVGSGQN